MVLGLQHNIIVVYSMRNQRKYLDTLFEYRSGQDNLVLAHSLDTPAQDICEQLMAETDTQAWQSRFDGTIDLVGCVQKR